MADVWRRRARLRRRSLRLIAAAALLFIIGWITVENVGLARFLGAPASDLTSIPSPDAWPTAGGGPSRDGVARALGTLRGEPAWEVDLGAPPGGSPVIARDSIYIGSTDGRVHARSLADGTELWTRDVGAPVRSTPSVAGDLLFVGLLDGRIVAMSTETGEPAWEFQTGQAVRSSPAVVDGVLYVGSSDHRLYALDASSGKERWSFATGGRITSSPSVNERLVVVTSQDNFIHFIDHHTAKRRFDYKISLTNGSAAIAGDSVFASDFSGTIRRIHWDERELPFEKAIRQVRRWMFRWGMANELPRQKGVVWVTQDFGESFVGTPAVDRSAVYASTSSGKLVAYDKATGVELWRTSVGSSVLTSPTVAGDQVLVGDRSGTLSSIDRKTGAVTSLSTLRGAVTSGIAVSGGLFAVATDAGLLYVFR